MEERIIDDEYARGIRLKKTKDGYIDATDELAEKERRAAEELEADELNATAEEENEAAGETEETLVLDGLDESLEETAGEEVTFEFPDLEEDDEDLVNLTPEEAIALRKQKEAEEAERKATYKRLCEEGEELLVSGSFKAAELKFEKALGYDEEAVEAAVGYWRSKTSDFTSPDALAEEYAETGFESLENDLGESAVEKIKERYKSVFEGRLAALEEEEKPLEAEVLEKQEKRRAILKKRISSALKKTLLHGHSHGGSADLHDRVRRAYPHPSGRAVRRADHRRGNRMLHLLYPVRGLCQQAGKRAAHQSRQRGSFLYGGRGKAVEDPRV